VVVLPTAEAVAGLLGALYGKSVDVEGCGAVSPRPRAPSVVAAYYDRQGVFEAVCLCDLAFAAGAGAALSLMPADVAVRCVRRQELDEYVLQNLHEVLNVAAQLFSVGHGGGLVLRGFYLLPGALPDEVSALLQSPAARLDIQVTISGYRPGKMALLAATPAAVEPAPAAPVSAS